MVATADRFNPQEVAAIETRSVLEVYKLLETRPGGLSQAEAADRLARFGPNAIIELKRKPLILKFLANFIHLMAVLLWLAGFVAIIAKMPQLAVSIWMVNLINGVFSFWQEFKAERATEAMRRMLPSYATVLREGVAQRLEAQSLVPGDVVILATGDRICADARLLEAAELRLDQSTLTGESLHVRKIHEAVSSVNLARIEIPNLVFAGTSVVSGAGKGVITHTGMHTEFGKIAGFTQSLGADLSPLQKEMQRVTKLVTVIAIAAGAVFFLLAVTLAGVDLSASFIFAMGMIVAFVPEGLLPTVTLSLAMGVQRMAGRNALIKRLSAVETLGSTSVICTDKTGTLTQNEMTVRHLWISGQSLSVTGAGYGPVGQILNGSKSLVADEEVSVRQLLLSAGLCNNARLLEPQKENSCWTVIGDPTEGALLVAARKAGLDLKAEERATPRRMEFPFDSRRKRMSTVHQDGDKLLVYVKGAAREVLNLSSRIAQNGNEIDLDEKARAAIMAANDGYARKGLRVLAVAKRVIFPPEDGSAPTAAGKLSAEAVERQLTFLGLIALMDPPRPEIHAAVETCHRAGIRIIMITGDYGLTAESIARRIGIIRSRQPAILNGADLDSINDEVLIQSLKGEVIFARVAPEHKLRIVKTLQGIGHVVAVTGDGVNDAPALKKADIGVAMGVHGDDVAKEAADMILLDDNFASIVNAIGEGRAVYANIKKFTTYIFTSNTPEAVPFILFALSGGLIPLALNVMHILAIDLGTDLIPALGLGAEKLEPGLMEKPPRNLNEHVVTSSMLTEAYLFLGPLQSLAVMAAFYFQYWTHGYWGQWFGLPASGALYESATAMALACVVTTQIGNLFAQRTDRISAFRMGWFTNGLLWAGVFSELGVIFLIVYVPPVQKLIGTQAFEATNWIFLFAWAPLLLFADEGRKFLLRSNERRANPGGRA